MSKRKTHSEKILEHIQKHGEITQREAFYFGCQRLSARIYDLKHKERVPIITESRTVKNSDGSTATIAVYKIAATASQEEERC